jgi:cytidine deaminase
VTFEALLDDVLRDDFRGVIPAEQAVELAEAAASRDVMQLLVPVAQRYAISPISTVEVGAVARGSSGGLYLGANMEYPGTVLGVTVHAEQAATINAWQNGEHGLDAIAVSHAPCGYCRQFLFELTTAATLTVHIGGKPPQLLTRLFPEPFGPADLDVEKTLMTPENHGLKLIEPSSDELVAEALDAANASYAPHSKGYAGVVLETRGASYAGRYAENAAFNPSVPPLASALVMRALAGAAGDAVTRAVLVETASSKVRHEPATRELLRVIAPEIELEIAVAG